MTRQRVINMRNPMSRSTHRFPSGSPEISHYCTGGGINQNCCSGFTVKFIVFLLSGALGWNQGGSFLSAVTPN